MTPLVIEPAEWIERSMSAGLDASPLGDDPTVVVLDGPWEGGPARARPELPSVPVVGRVRSPVDHGVHVLDCCDVVIGEVGDESPGAVPGGTGAVDELVAAIDAHPLAAAVLCQVLRASADLDLATGLLVESLAYATLQAGPDHRSWLDGRRGTDAMPTASHGSVVAVDRIADRLDVELCRPDVHNALDTAMRDQLVAAFDLAAADPSITTVALSGRGPSFCAGGDLSDFGTAPDPATAHAVRSLRLPARSIARIADRVYARVHGASVGAGVELAAFAGQVEAAPDATFRLPELAMGLVPGSGGTVSLPRRIGRQRTGWMALSGRPLDATEALGWGLVDRIGPSV